MSIEKTIRTLNIFSDTIREELEKQKEMSEVHLVAVDRNDLEAIRKAVIVMESVRIMNGVFDKEAAQ